MAPIDPNRFRVRWRPFASLNGKAPRPRHGEPFLKGPIPLAWLEAAARLPGKSLHTGLALWFSAGVTRSSSVPLSNIASQRFGIDRNAKYRALIWLERAGLVSVERGPGRAPMVTIRNREPPGGVACARPVSASRIVRTCSAIAPAGSRRTTPQRS